MIFLFFIISTRSFISFQHRLSTLYSKKKQQPLNKLSWNHSCTAVFRHRVLNLRKKTVRNFCSKFVCILFSASASVFFLTDNLWINFIMASTHKSFLFAIIKNFNMYNWKKCYIVSIFIVRWSQFASRLFLGRWFPSLICNE